MSVVNNVVNLAADKLLDEFDSATDSLVAPKDKKAAFKRCHEDHKAVKILAGEFRGGACAHPHPGYDIYVGLDWSMSFFGNHYPWEAPTDTAVPEHEFQYKIADGKGPVSVQSFKAMITWMVGQLKLGKKIHVGCIGGHGRTGLVLAALIAEATGEKDPIKWARDNHCKKSVESAEQVAFLVKHYGAATAEPSKGHYTPAGGGYGGTYTGGYGGYGGSGVNFDRQAAVDRYNSKYPSSKGSRVSRGLEAVPCVGTQLSIWGGTAIIKSTVS